MTTIKVPDMMCENCVKRITNALTAAELKLSLIHISDPTRREVIAYSLVGWY